MRMKMLFEIPEETKVTEKVFARVLISSVCSILLCMACLAGTTWAWFVASIENTDNIIQIATVRKNVTITNRMDHSGIESQNGSYSLTKGSYNVNVKLESDATGSDELNKGKSAAYVLMSIADADGEVKYYYFAFEGGRTEVQQILEVESDLVMINFSVSWMRPASAEQIGDIPIAVGEEIMNPTTPAAAPTEAEDVEPSVDTDETEVLETTEATTIPEEESVPETTQATEDTMEPVETEAENELGIA